MTTEPDIRILSLGAGRQSTALAVMAADGDLPPIDAAVFADTGWEPAAVYEHLDRLEAYLAARGIPLYRVSQGNLRRDAVDPDHRFASIPYFVLAPPHDVPVLERCPVGCGWAEYLAGPEHDVSAPPPGCLTCGSSGHVQVGTRPATRAEREGMGRRQCTSEYKLAPIMRKVRELLGAPAPDFRRVPRGRLAEQWIGFAYDEPERIGGGRGVLYERKRYPLVDEKVTTAECVRYLRARGWGWVSKSACIGCPYHGNAMWRDLRDNRPAEWADAVAFDRAIRKGGARGTPLNGEAFLHRSCLPLDEAPIDRVTRSERRAAQGDLLELAAEDAVDASLAGQGHDVEEDGDPDGCSPYGCRSGAPVDLDLPTIGGRA